MEDSNYPDVLYPGQDKVVGVRDVLPRYLSRGRVFTGLSRQGIDPPRPSGLARGLEETKDHKFRNTLEEGLLLYWVTERR